ncbi:MFS transporter [Paenisporosarcina cavernae]|uniref:MFS transporter n=1 Tax=Paenisporosarcina cavernae TaxID=2320858 RepID=A0A385YSJ9_9BACL|nr:MFS transporter [Paenisporosarcina cavernae]AYC29481.1 MFS transporter [Paenisporosarcina cavernae]
MFKNRNVWIILAGEMIAGLGLWTGIIGNLEFMQHEIPSDFLKSVIMAIGLLAGIAIGPLAGRIIDTSRKKTVLILSGIGRMLSVIFMLIAISTGSIWWMVAFMISIQLSAAFYFPALQATIPLVVSDEKLLQMNGYHMNVATLSRIAGTALAGVVLVYWSLQSLYIVSMVAYAGLLLFTFFLQIEEKREEREAQIKLPNATKSSFMDMFPVIKGYPAVLMGLVLLLIPLLFIGSFNLIVINISEIQDSSSIKGLIYAVEGTSVMLGSFLVKYLQKKWKTGVLIFFFASMIGVAQYLLVFAESQLLTLLAFGVFGYSVGSFFPSIMTIFQRQMPKEYHGRFFSFRNMLERIVFQIVLLVTGGLLDLIGLQWMVILFGSFSFIMSFVFWLQVKKHQIELDTNTTLATT